MNVIPETCTAHVNFRYAPGRTPDEAEARLRELTQGLGTLTVIGHAPSGAVVVDHPLARKLIQAGSLTVAPEQRVDAGGGVRLGRVSRRELRAGATSQAHQRGEYVEIDALLRAFGVLEAFGT